MFELHRTVYVQINCCLDVFFVTIVFTARNSSCGKVMFSQVSVILFGGGGYGVTSCLVICSFWGMMSLPVWFNVLSGRGGGGRGV